MNRRDFLHALGIATGALAVAPATLLHVDDTSFVPDILPAHVQRLWTTTGYPPPYFTGFKPAMNQDLFAGQFIWGVIWDDGVKEDLTHWYTTVAFSKKDLYQHKADPGTVLRWKLRSGIMQFLHMIDGVVEDAENNLAEIVAYDPNPDFDPRHARMHDPSDDDWNFRCLKCSQHIQTARKIPVFRSRPISYGDMTNLRAMRAAGGDPWKIQYSATPDLVPLEKLAIESVMKFVPNKERQIWQQTLTTRT